MVQHVDETSASGVTGSRGERPAEHGERVTAGVIALVAGSMPMISLLSANGLAPLIIVAAVVILFAGPRRRILAMGPKWPGLALVLLAVLGFLSALWSIVPAASLHKTLQLLPLFASAYLVIAAAMTLSPLARERVGRWLAAGLVVAFVFVLTEVLVGGVVNHLLTGEPLGSGNALLRYKRGIAVMALLVIPVAYWLGSKHGAMAAAAVIAAAILSAATVGNGTALLAMLVGVLWVFVAFLFPLLGRRGLAVALMIVILGSPLFVFGPTGSTQLRHGSQFISAYRLNSAVHRFLIWQFVGGKIIERPVIGWGLDSSRSIPGGNERLEEFPERLPLHPHNAALQIWLELGALGALIASFVVMWPVVRLNRTLAPGLGQAAAAGTAVATVTVALLAFGIWQSWWIGAIGLATACAAAILPPRAGVSDTGAP